ncbi:hypothetical protein ACFCXT_19890 [Streptomyces vinaceus]|uniref:hypothetical protein n=1 Tax=Streptomyces vinaceus TaxID=1960 RepID=UPI0035E3B072
MGQADQEWFPDLAGRRLNQLSWPEIEEHRDYIEQLLETFTVTTIHQRSRDERTLKASLTSLRRWVHEKLPDEAARSRVTVLRDDVEPGSEAQIDYGSGSSRRLLLSRIGMCSSGRPQATCI